MTWPPTRFAGLSRRPARIIALALLGAIALSLAAASSLQRWSFGQPRPADLEFYRDIVAQVHQGVDYYEAVDRAFGGEPARSMFNWRLPTYAWMLGALPDPAWVRWLFLAAALTAAIAAARTLLAPDCGPIAQVAGTLLLLGGAFAWGFYDPDLYFATEPWCEALLLLSLCAYARGWWKGGMAAAVTALLLRELVLPFCLVAAGIALWRRRRAEVVLWIVLLAGYVVVLWLHAGAIARQHPDVPMLAVGDWLKPSGLRFVLQSCAMNLALRPSPPELLAFYMPLALLGLAAWPGEIGARLLLSAAIYVGAFCLVTGFDYWGHLYAPVLVLGVVRAPAALRDLWGAGFTSRASPA